MSAPPIPSSTTSAQELLTLAAAAKDAAQWERAVTLYSQVEQLAPQSGEVKHNLALCYFGWGKPELALQRSTSAVALNSALWQSQILMAKCYHALGQMEFAQAAYQKAIDGVGGSPEGAAHARLGLADLEMNQFGNPLAASDLVAPLLNNSRFAVDAQLTSLMASLYDRADWNKPGNARALSKRIQSFSAAHLRLPNLWLEPLKDRSALYQRAGFRPRVGLISPLFCISPVYFLTIAGWRHVAKGCDIVIFNRGHQSDWASDAFKELASEWHNVEHLNATQLASQIHAADIDVLYDLGGWMDAIGLQALSTKPARQMFKWVGGQSVTTGLDCFDGWIGDETQSPARLQSLYSERLIQVPSSYCSYTPPSYLPKPAKNKSSTACIFANPAKLSRAFLAQLKKMPGSKVLIHKQYRYAQVQERIREQLGDSARLLEFIAPTTHEDALRAVNAHAVMIDTFPYSSGLTAREALAMGTQVRVLKVGELFCERHTANLIP